jgi:type II secretion system protein H
MDIHRSKFAARSGFTLMELVLVMLVLSVVAATVVPALRNFAHGRELNDAAAQVVAVSNYARTQAIAEGRVYRLTLDLSAGTYQLTARTYDTFDALQNNMGHAFTVPEKVRMDCDFPPQQDGLYLEFRPTGRIDTGLIRLEDDAGNVKEIVCDGPTELFHIIE